jgi:NAD(P)-dependent dehydrogenase (short-subunit alcohol dehydrogenase family)
MKLEFDLSGARVWVTGASRGLGRAIAHGFLNAGADVALTARDARALNEVEKEASPFPGRILKLPGSVSDTAQVRDCVAEIVTKWGGLDVLVNCAGVSPIFKRAETIEDDEWRAVIDVNTSGTFYCCREAGGIMARNGGGSIVNISSVHGQVAGRRLAAYSASKGAVDALTRTLAAEWAEHSIRVNTISPGYFETDMTAGLLDSGRWRDHLLERTPMRRVGHPSELVPAVMFLASNASGFMTGANLVVDGGWSAE